MMKTLARALWVSLVLVTTLTGSSLARDIGPDAYGYLATDNVPYAWEDISATGTRTLYLSDDGTYTGNLGFTFGFYGRDYTQVSWSPNGLMTFGGSSWDWSNECFTTEDGPDNLPCVAVLWDDWISHVGGSGVYYQTRGLPGNRRFILQWNNLDGYSYSPSTVTFQALLFESRPNDILLQYRDVYSGDERNNGGSATVGIRNVSGHLTGENLQWSCNQPVISAGQAILYRVPEPATLSLLATLGGCGALCLWIRRRQRR